MTGFLPHLLLSLRLNFRNKQAIVFGYLVPVFFLVAFGAFYRGRLGAEQMAQLLTITVLGGACFGMPIAIVTERERGVWRRYRLTPMPPAGFLVSTLLSRYVLVLSSALIQLGLAMRMYGTPAPQHPWTLLGAFTLACFAFLSIGLVIAMVATSTQAVQALGQSLFLPVIMIGGVGVPLSGLPRWSKHLAAFLPGKYAVESLRLAFVDPRILPKHPWFNYAALTLIGLAALLAGLKLFRWENRQRIAPRDLAWVAVALVMWVLVGMTAEWLKLI